MSDISSPGFMSRLPEPLRPFAELARYDRPIGIWLLVIPCWIGLALARIGEQVMLIDAWYALLFGIGAVAMRGAGCTWNDMMDRNLDAQVARTANRPLASGRVGMTSASLWLGVQLLVGLAVWLALPMAAKLIALLTLPLVAAYPFMKRITWWPQAWLGLTFNAGLIIAVATAERGFPGLSAWIVYLGLAVWTVGYDTIYALQDIEDDSLVGVRSTARLFGTNVRVAVLGLYILAPLIVALGLWIAGAGNLSALAAIAFLLHLIWQVVRLDEDQPARALAVFKSSRTAGLILLAGTALAAFFVN